MRTAFCALLVIGIIAITGCGPSAPDGGFGESDFVELMDSIDLNASDNTSLNVKTRWAEVEGKGVAWEGEVVDIKGGRGGRVEIYVKKEGKPLHRGYNVIVTSYDEAKAGKLKKGNEVTFKGLISRKSQRSNGPLVIYIDNAEILD